MHDTSSHPPTTCASLFHPLLSQLIAKLLFLSITCNIPRIEAKILFSRPIHTSFSTHLSLPRDLSIPEFVNDNCSSCCHLENGQFSTQISQVPSCCIPTTSDLFNTPNGECSGLPCCTYGGRKAQNHQSHFPCLTFPSCRYDSSKQPLCAGSLTWLYSPSPIFNCTDPCCKESSLMTNTWKGVSLAYPGQINATFSILLRRSDYITAFYGTDTTKRLQQVVIASPPGYAFTSLSPHCYLMELSRMEALCFVREYNNRYYIHYNIPTELQKSEEPMQLIFDHVSTPSGLYSTYEDLDEIKYDTDTNLTPIYYIFDDSNGGVFSSFLRVSALEAASISSASFVPENIFPGNAGNASLSFLSNARIPVNSIISIQFDRRWKFLGSETWDIQIGIDDLHERETENSELSLDNAFIANDTGSATEHADLMAVTDVRRVREARYDVATGRWLLPVSEPIKSGWVLLQVSQVQNPTMSYSGLNQIRIHVYDSNDQLIVDGAVCAISEDSMAGTSASSYSYVSIVVLIGSLLFCIVVIRSNGLSFSLGSIWTDITAICTLLALGTAIINNILYTIIRSSAYYYISRIQLCFTFTMLLAVSFHWGTVLSLRLRKLPKKKVCFAFVVMNLGFYAFQVAFLLTHQRLIDQVYQYENDPSSLLNLQCKGEDMQLLSSAFSDLPSYLWTCYVSDQEQFFLISTAVTYAVFLALTLVVMALGVMVMRRGRSLLIQMTGLHELVLRKALRLYYALIGVVTLIYLLSWIVQLLSRNRIAYPWYYIFTVWLPYSIPPCCLVFLQWNSTAKSLREMPSDSEHCELQEEDDYSVRTPSCSFSSCKSYSDQEDESAENVSKESSGASAMILQRQSQRAASIQTPELSQYISLSLILEIHELFEQGCYIGIQRLEFSADSNRYLWKQISNTDTAYSSSSKSLYAQIYTFMSVPRIALHAAGEEKLRMIVYCKEPLSRPLDHRDPSVITAEAVIARLHSHSFEQDTSLADKSDLCLHLTNFLEKEESSQAIEDLFEDESDFEDEVMQEERPIVAAQWRVVAEFSVSMDRLLDYGACGEQLTLIASEKSFRTIQESNVAAAPPKLYIYPVLPRLSQHGAMQNANSLIAAQRISSQYHIREQNLLIVEDLTESRFNNLIPRQVMQIIFRQRKKSLMQAEQDLSRLDSYDRVRAKTSSRNIYENLIEQIQDDGDVTRCREYMLRRVEARKQYVRLLNQLHKLYKRRDHDQRFFKASTERNNGTLRFLPINLHLHEMWVAQVHSNQKQRNLDTSPHSAPLIERSAVYDIVTVGAMAAHVYKFRNGGILGLEEQRQKAQGRERRFRRKQSPLWSEQEQKVDDLNWEIQKRMDVCFPQAVAALITCFTRKLDVAVQVSTQSVGRGMLDQYENVGFLFDVESLLSTHGNEAGMLEDMAAALNELRNVRFLLIEETHEKGNEHAHPERMGMQFVSTEGRTTASANSAQAPANSMTMTTNTSDSQPCDSDNVHHPIEADNVYHPMDLDNVYHSGQTDINTNDTGSSMMFHAYNGLAGVVRVDVFSSIESALKKYPGHAFWHRHEDENRNSFSSSSGSSGSHNGNNNHPDAGTLDRATSMLSRGQHWLGYLLKNTYKTARKDAATGKKYKDVNEDAGCIQMSKEWHELFDDLFAYTHLIVRVTVRSPLIHLSPRLRDGALIRVQPVLFSQGINEKQTIANNTKSSTRQLQDVINAASLRSLRMYCDRYADYMTRESDCATVGREEMQAIISELENLILLSQQTRKKRPEILQLSSDLCRRLNGGRVTCCKSAKDRTGMSVTLEQGRILVANHELPETKRGEIVSVMRSEGVRIENCCKNTGRRMYAFNALQRSLLPEEYRCPPHTGGTNLS